VKSIHAHAAHQTLVPPASAGRVTAKRMVYFHREDIPRCRGATGLQALLVEQRQHGGAGQAVQAFSDPSLRLHVRLQKTQGLVEIWWCRSKK